MPDSSTSEHEFVCDCDERSRPACAREPFYKEHQSKRYCVLHFPGKEKSADFEKALQRKLGNKDFNFIGVWFPGDVSFNQFHFSGRVSFDRATFSGSAHFYAAIFSGDADFRFATFSGRVSFDRATFSGSARFSNTTFSGSARFGAATFSGLALFSDATFSGSAHFGAATFSADAEFRFATFSAQADFHKAAFSGQAHFLGATFGARTNFTSATFSAEVSFDQTTFIAEAYFSSTTFSANATFHYAAFNIEADFFAATFNGLMSFRAAIFGDHVRFAGHESTPGFMESSALDLQFATIEKPEHVSFHMLTLLPHWFVNVDSRRFEFTNVDWHWRSIPEQIAKMGIPDRLVTHGDPTLLLESDKVSSTHRVLSIACQRLATNAENNNEYEDASRLRYMAMDARRLEKWGGFAVWKLSWWYWLVSGYGERSLKALMVLLGILIIFAALYTRVGFARWEPRLGNEADAIIAKRDNVGSPLEFSRALAYSAGVMTLQKPEPRPATRTAHVLVLLETILGPVQAALLALAIRRKFMR